MKKIITFAGIAILFVLLSAPSFVSASEKVGVGLLWNSWYERYEISDIYCDIAEPTWIYMGNNTILYTSPIKNNTSGATSFYYYPNYPNSSSTLLSLNGSKAIYIPTLDGNYTFNNTTKIFNNIPDFNEAVPEADRLPEPTWQQKLWDNFLNFLEFELGLDPFDGGIWKFFNDYINDPDNNTLEIIFPTNAPTPTPTPRPTPIPVQTIYVPDGNGSYTIVYQYPDPSGTITQSPYNPNIDVNVDVDCDCDGGSQNYYPQDPMYAPLEGLSWSSPDGDLTGSPAMSASQSLDAIKAEVDSYDEPIKVVSNSFGALPGKWLSLVGLLGACLIVAGLIRTFLGG